MSAFTDMPIVRLELERMKYQIVHALESHNEELEKAVAEELEKVIANYPFEAEVSRIANGIISKAIEESLREFMVWGEGKKRFREIIDAKLRDLFGEE